MWGSTPQKDYGAVPTNESGADKPAMSRDQITQLIKQAESSDWTWKILGMLGGVAMIFTGSMNLTQQIQDLNGFSAIFDLYVIFFGVLTMGLEFKDQILSQSWQNTLKVDAKFMYKPFGRGNKFLLIVLDITTRAFFLVVLICLFFHNVSYVIINICIFFYFACNLAVLYLFFGVLLLSQQPVIYISTGLYLLAVGTLVIYAAKINQQEIEAFKAKKKSYAELKDHYEKADTKKTGLTVKELAKVVCGFEGNSMSESEMTSALMILDKKNTGIVSFEDFAKWYIS